MKGRKPKPTKLKIVTGNPGKRALNEREPQPESGLPECPAHLNAEARKKWEQLAKDAGWLARVDADVLAAYCVAYSRWVKAEGKVEASGEVLKSKDGGMFQNPFLSVANRAMEQLRQFAALLGLDPADRARLKTDSAGKQEDPFEEFLKRRGNQA